jgi:hypothetical protein
MALPNQTKSMHSAPPLRGEADSSPLFREAEEKERMDGFFGFFGFAKSNQTATQCGPHLRNAEKRTPPLRRETDGEQ